MNRANYVQKVLSILSQQDKFQQIGDAKSNDRTTQQERALQAFLLRAKKSGHITKEAYGRIRSVGTSPRMYGVL